MYRLLILLAFGPSVHNLGSDDYQTREAAEARLSRHVYLCWPLLDSCYNNPQTDLETRTRIRRIIRKVIPNNPPPISLLSGNPMPEWYYLDSSYVTISYIRPGIQWRLGYMRPDTSAPLHSVIHHYGEKARTQYQWKDWHIDSDGRRATQLFCKDLLRFGIPPCLVSRLIDYLRAKEDRLSLTSNSTYLSPRKGNRKLRNRNG